jgi:ABC-type transport system substrate-binding protein
MNKLLYGLALTCLLAACAPAEPSALIWARSADSSTLDPAEIEWGEDAKVSQNIFEPLVTFKPDSVELEGRLAKSWMFSPDGKTLTFELQENVKFHDGTTLDADDVVFTFERLMNQHHPHKPKAVPYSTNFSMIETVRADGDRRVVFQLKQPSATILWSLSLFGAGIVSPEAVQKYGDKWPVTPVGTGPYRLERWDRDVKIVLDRFADYWGEKPEIERVIVVPVQSPQTAIQKLKQGEVHVIDHPTLADVKPLQSDSTLKVDFETSMNVSYLGFNMRKHPYNDKNFRMAVSLALDRSSLNNLAYYDLAEPAANIVPPAIWHEIAPTPPYEYNLEKARELLSKVKLDSKEIELIHMTFARPYVAEPQRVAEWVKDQLRKIGLEVKLTGYDIQAYTVKTRDPEHPMYLLGWSMDYPDPDNFFYPLLHGDNAGDLNGSFFNDPRFNEAVTKAQTERDPARRAALYAVAYERYRDEQPSIPLVHVRQLIAFSNRISYNMHPAEYRFYIASFAR